MSVPNPLLRVVRGEQPLSAHAMTPRARQHMLDVLADTRMKARGAPAHHAFERALRAGGPLDATGFIETLWNAPGNQDLVQEFMSVPLCVDAAKGIQTALDAYRQYAAQDFFYLTNYVTFKVLRYQTATADHSVPAETKQAQDVLDDAQYALDWLNTCKDKIGIIDMDDVKANDAVLQYAKFLDAVARSDNWFSLHVILIACNYGWSKLALSLYSEGMNKTTDFYKYWLADSLDLSNPAAPALSSYALALDKFLTQNAAEYASRLQTEDTNKLFRDGLILEIALFNSVYTRGG